LRRRKEERRYKRELRVSNCGCGRSEEDEGGFWLAELPEAQDPLYKYMPTRQPKAIIPLH
jgi:hypothetical protein